MAVTFQSAWKQLQQGLSEAGEPLIAECRAANDELNAMWEELSAEYRAANPPDIPPGRVDSLQSLYGEPTNGLLHGPVSRARIAQPQRRALAAFEQYLRRLDEITAEAPASVGCSGKKLAEALAGQAVPSWRRAWLARSEKRRRIDVRAAVERVGRRDRPRLLRCIGAFMLRAAQLEEALTDPWEATVEEGLRRLDGSGSDPKEFEHDRRRWLRFGERRRQEAARALEGLQTALAALPRRLASELSRLRQPGSLRLPQPADRTGECLAHWSRQRQAVASQRELSVALAQLGGRFASILSTALDQLDSEQRDLAAELDLFTERLRQWDGSLDPKFLPPPTTNLPSAADRGMELAAELRQAAGAALPEQTELVSPRSATPSLRPPWRQVRPVDIMSAGTDAVTQESRMTGFLEVEKAHQRIVADIEHAWQVAMYGLEAAEQENAPELAREAVGNALTLVERRRNKTPDASSLAAPSLTEAVAAALARCIAAVAEGRFGLVARLARQRGPRLLSEAAGRSSLGLQRLVRLAWTGLTAANRWLLIRIGWERPPESGLEIVERRPALALGFAQIETRELPLIYAHLFRPEPVADPRFLIGREVEMGAIQECRQAWEAKQPTALLIVGERGSGKTSMLNCARVRIFSDVPVTSGGIRERLTSAAGMDAYLRKLFDLGDQDDVVEALRARRGLAIVEELENAYLRRIGGFEAFERLISVIAKTNRSILWALAINQAAFKLTDAAVGLHRVFSHRLNARAVSSEHLTDAILHRHNFSGLRLQFQGAPGNARVRRLRSALGLQQSPRERYFEALHDQSRGVFRSAFQLWHASIIHSGGGVLRMREPPSPDLKALNACLEQRDLFALQAILQHGALLAEEYALIFDVTIEAGLDQLSRLDEIGLIEQEKASAALRVRPEASHIVRRILDSNNLL